MIEYMLGKLTAQARQLVTLQKDGDLSAALGGYELIFEALRFYEELGRLQEVMDIQRLVLAAQSGPEMTLYLHALILFHRRRYHAAEEAIAAALLLGPDMPLLQTLQAKVRTSLGDLSGALEAYERAQALAPTAGGTREALFMLAAEQEMPGEDYYFWLQRFHEQLHPASYVEIGLGHGRSLALAGPATRTVGIDPF